MYIIFLPTQEVGKGPQPVFVQLIGFEIDPLFQIYPGIQTTFQAPPSVKFDNADGPDSNCCFSGERKVVGSEQNRAEQNF